MTPRLLAIAGPLKGTVFSILEDEVSIGREIGNSLCINDLSLSRKHCRIEKKDNQYYLTDLDSLNGTFVNKIPVKERLLEHDCQIETGDSVFLFLLREEELSPAHRVVQTDEALAVGHSTIRLQKDEFLYMHSGRLAQSLPEENRIARHLNALLKISSVINSIRKTDALCHKLLELIFETVPAQRGAILLGSGYPMDFTSEFSYERSAGLGSQVKVSRTVVDQVIREGVAILSNDIASHETLSKAASLTSSQVNSLLCVPLLGPGDLRGVVYLDTMNPSVPFAEEDLHLMTAIAGIAAVALGNIQQLEWLGAENNRLRTQDIDHNIIGESSAIREVLNFIARIAPSASTVLIHGESGTGKELVARAIHQNSPRSANPFVAINCAALTETLLESELFGHEKGAFTGAIAQKKGRIEIAHTGTLFLDEIADLALPLQSKLLRVLQEREFERVGGTRPIKVDIRLVTATNQNLKDAVKRGAFRQDLYYRLDVVSVRMPPLREHRDDIPLLATYFAAKYSSQVKRRIRGISPDARALLLNYDWPGNVRELENAIERAVVMGTTDLLLPEDLPETVTELQPPSGVHATKYHEAIAGCKKQLILKAVEDSNGVYTEAAKLLGVHPNYLHRLIRNLNLKSDLKK